MRSFTEASPRVIGVIVAALTVAGIAAVLLVNRGMFESTYPLHARFADAAGVDPGTPVMLAGVDVGSVGTVRLAGNGVDTVLDVNDGVELPARTSAAISVETVLGNLDVTLQPLGGWSHPLGPGATISQTSVPTELYQVQNEAGGLLSRTDAGALNQLITSLATITQGKQHQVAEIVNGLNGFTGVIDQRRSQVSQLINAANTLSSTVAQRDQALASTVTNLSQVVQGLAERSTDLGSLIDNTQRAAAQLSTLIGTNQPQLSQLVNHLDSVLAVLSNHQLDLAEGISSATSAVTGFASIGSSGSTPNPSWANVYTNLLTTSGALDVLGACGTLDQVLNEALGPDPLPCDQQTGPPVTSTSSSPGGSSPSTSSSSSSPSSAGGNAGQASAAHSDASGSNAAAPSSSATSAGTSPGNGSSADTTPTGSSLGGLMQSLLGGGT